MDRRMDLNDNVQLEAANVIVLGRIIRCWMMWAGLP